MVANTVAPKWSIYKVTCLVNGKAYVGLTKGSPINRWRNHIWRANSKTKSIVRFALHWAVLVHGAANFRLEVLGTYSSLANASEAEQRAIEEHRTMRPRGYNLTDGGMGTPGVRRPHSPETKRKIGAAQVGRIIPAEARAKMSAAKKGRKLSAAHVEKLRAINKARSRPSEYYSRMSKMKTGNPVPIKSLRFLREAIASIDAGTSKNVRSEHGRFSTRINVGGQRRKHLGTFDTYEQALAVYRAAVVARIEEIERAHPSIGRAVVAQPHAT